MELNELNLEELILNLLDTSPAIREKIQNIFNEGYNEEPKELISAPNSSSFNRFDKRKNLIIDTDVDELVKIRADLTVKVQKLEEEKSKFEERIKQLLDNSSNLEEKNKTLETELADVKSEKSQFEIQLKELTEKYTDLEKSTTDLQTEINEEKNALTTENESLKLQIQELTNDYNSLMNENKELESKNISAKIEYNYKLEDAEREKDKLELQIQQLTNDNNDLNALGDVFREPVDYLNKYKTLSASIRTGLSDIVCDKNEILFVTSCATPEHLKALWMYTKKLIGRNESEDDIITLKNIFDYFFNVYNSTLKEPMYERDNVEAGYTFDDDKYDRCIGSLTSGKISRVALKGYKSVNTGAIICRSLVCV